jgi:hypothetical protein
VIQDHIESIGKPILLKGDEVLIMTQLLKCLVVLLQNPQTLLHITSIQNPKSIISVPPNFHIPDSPSWSHILPKPNPNFSVQPKWLSVSPRRRDHVSVTMSLHFRISEMKFLELPKRGLALAIALRSHRDVLFGLTETSSVRSFTLVGLTEILVWCHRVESKTCNCWIFGWSLYIPIHPHLL